MKITATEIKKFDNKVTYVIGYRNLYNILIVAFAVVMGMFAAQNSLPYYTAVIIGLMAGKWLITQMQENVDALSVLEI
jgi:hypothetical protein